MEDRIMETNTEFKGTIKHIQNKYETLEVRIQKHSETHKAESTDIQNAAIKAQTEFELR